MLDLWPFVLVALAAYRVTRFFVFDSLMGFNLESRSKMSRWLDVRSYNSDGSDRDDRSWLWLKTVDLLVCPFCLGFWITFGIWAAVYYGPSWVLVPVAVFALAGVQTLLNATERKLR